MADSSQPNGQNNLPNRADNPPTDPQPERIPEYQSRDLLHGHRELLIHHGGETYRLRLTKTGKLILNK